MAGPGTFETPAGAIDGVNPTFTTSLPFVAGSVDIWHDGLLKNDAVGFTDGFDEVPPNTITMRTPPLTGDELRARYVIEVPS